MHHLFKIKMRNCVVAEKRWFCYISGMNLKAYIWPSLLAGDFGRLEESALKAQAAGADALHLDIMDGHFVPNLSMGPDVVKMARGCLSIPLNVHLMMTRPDLYIEPFVKAGADGLSIHVESRCDVGKTIRRIRTLGARPGVVLNPETPAGCVMPFLEDVDFVLCMTVHPGFGGQSFMPSVLPKIGEIRKGAGERDLVIAVDGGIDLDNCSAVAAVGANALVVGSSLFRSDDMSRDIALMRRRAEACLAGRAHG